MSEADRTIAVLSNTEQQIGFLNPDYVQIVEINELYKLRTIKIVHLLTDENNHDLSRYDTILRHGNKLFRVKTTDGDSCLYVMHGAKIYDYASNTVTINAVECAYELGRYKIVRNSAFSWVVNSDFIVSTFGALFNPGVLTGPATVTAYNGALTPLAIINEIQVKTGGEFQYRYVWDTENKQINRYLDFKAQIGITHTTPVELGYNAKSMNLEVDESNVGIAAGPVGEPGSTNDTFHADRLAFENLPVAKGQSIPLYYTKDDSGTLVPGPSAYAPYAKQAGENYVVCDEPSELIASYQYIQSKAGTTGIIPVITTFSSTETNPTNMYWLCVDTIREHLKPEVKLDCDLVDLKKLKGWGTEQYNIGDIVPVIVPGRSGVVPCRISKTTKDPRKAESENIEMSNFNTSFMAEFFKSSFKSPGAINIQ